MITTRAKNHCPTQSIIANCFCGKIKVATGMEDIWILPFNAINEGRITDDDLSNLLNMEYIKCEDCL